MEIPLGWRFQPRDHELLRFLFYFVTGTSADYGYGYEGLVHHHDTFADKEPWELFRYRSSKKAAYFFTKLKRKGKFANGRRVDRTVRKGSAGNWHGQDRGKPVLNEEGKMLMGYKRSFIYKNKAEPEHDRQWLLKEFYLPETIIKNAMAEYPIVEERKDFVLWRLRRKKEEDQDEDQDQEMFAETATLQRMTESGPVETLPLAPAGDVDADGGHYINSYFDGVPAGDAADGGHADINGVPVSPPTLPILTRAGDVDGAHVINSYFDGRYDINSCFGGVFSGDAADGGHDINGVPAETATLPIAMETLAPAGDADGGHDMNLYFDISSFFDGVPSGDADGGHDINGVPVETATLPIAMETTLAPTGDADGADDINLYIDDIISYLDGVGVETTTTLPLAEGGLVETWALAGNADGVPVEALPELSSFPTQQNGDYCLAFQGFLWDREDVTQ